MDASSTTPAFSLEKAERLSKQLFPAYDEASDLTLKIQSLQTRRVQLLDVDSSFVRVPTSMAYMMLVTNGLHKEVETFLFNIGAHVQLLIGEVKESDAIVQEMERAKIGEKVRIVQQGGMLPPDDQYGDWEYDDDDGVGRGFSNIVNIDAVINAEKAKGIELKDKINFNATVDKLLRGHMSEFAVKAKMTDVEFDQWNRDSDLCLYTNTPLSTARPQMNAWFVKKFYKAVHEEEVEENRVKDIMWEIEGKEAAALADLAIKEPYVATCFTCKKQGHVDRDCKQVDIVKENGLNNEGKYAHLAHRGERLDRSKPKFCTTCSKAGHVEEYCPVTTHPEEDKENDCTYCGRDGHRADTCWRNHPELRREYLQKRKAFCGSCFKAGHYRDACTAVGVTYKYGLRPFRA
ncbi:uncharacterized protein RSE6_04456 [Rhynchosporium secalis]|uniref:CCHC-type domain-containing protein n=1 Tax=Rhynchosporium secalis TaxID=38038 RepID=A0A1E1M6P6_RHYSE|nr:uncharacterized protein RSE6_04456 [Rhynchosporium secalis]